MAGQSCVLRLKVRPSACLRAVAPVCLHAGWENLMSNFFPRLIVWRFVLLAIGSFLYLPGVTEAASTAITSPCLTITSPAYATIVRGSVNISTTDTCGGVWFESLFVDGKHVADFPTGKVVFNSTTVPHGAHPVRVT